MKCLICQGLLKEKNVNLPFEYKERFVLIRGIYAHVCQQCGEVYLPPDSNNQVKSVLDKIDNGQAKFKRLEVIVESLT